MWIDWALGRFFQLLDSLIQFDLTSMLMLINTLLFLIKDLSQLLKWVSIWKSIIYNFDLYNISPVVLNYQKYVAFWQLNTGDTLAWTNLDLYITGNNWSIIQRNLPIGVVVECSPTSQKTRVQFQVESYQRLKKWYLLPPCLTLYIILFTNPSYRRGYDSRLIFKRCLTGLNSEYSFS